MRFITKTETTQSYNDGIVSLLKVSVVDTETGTVVAVITQGVHQDSAEVIAKAEERAAHINARVAPGWTIRFHRPKFATRAEALRGMHRRIIVIVDSEGAETAYNSWDEVPELPADHVASAPVTEAVVTEAAAPVVSATVRGTITDAQADMITNLLADGEGGGFFSGPTDPAGIMALSREDASLYITSLKGEY